MADNYELTEQQKIEIQQAVNDQLNRMGEVFSHCWEYDEFKQAFIEDPKDSPEKTIVHVLPHDGVKGAVEGFNQILHKKVEDLGDNDGRQILLDGWKYEIYQNTPDKYYIVIPHSPENLSPEELEMVNGGCFFAVLIFVAEVLAIATTVAAAAEVAAVAVVAAAIVEAAAAITTAVAVAEGWIVVLTVTVLATANEAVIGYFITTNAEAINHAANVVTR